MSTRRLRSKRSAHGTSVDVISSESGDKEGAATKDVASVDGLNCSVCLNLFQDPYVTKCGHTFCHECILLALKSNSACPQCRLSLKEADLFVNYTIAALVSRERTQCHLQKQLKQSNPKKIPSQGRAPHEDDDCPAAKIMKLASSDMDLTTVSRLIDALHEKRVSLEADDAIMKNKLVKEFLSTMIDQRKQKITQINEELNTLEKDAHAVDARLGVDHQRQVPDSFSQRQSDAVCASPSLVGFDSFSSKGEVTVPQTTAVASSYSVRRERLINSMSELEPFYLDCRLRSQVAGDESESDGLNRFGDTLNRLTSFGSVRKLAHLNYNADVLNSAQSIVSSIEFDRDSEYFAIAGVTKIIKVFDYHRVLQQHLPCPVAEMQCNSKISCVGWNPYKKNLLVSSDYEGIVQLWDVATTTSTKKFHEHEKRCWSVSFNNCDPAMFASASDDAKVKLWSTSADSSIHTIEAKVNVCCVAFNPDSRWHIAFGSADHNVHYYDLRNTKHAQVILRDHKKAVSYVKFLNATELVSASTDNTLRVWSLTSNRCQTILKGHQNEKNFVGLTTNGHHVACGSEDNSLNVYYKSLEMPVVTYSSFSSDPNVFVRKERGPSVRDQSGEFVSAVCWRRNSNVVVAANSQGVCQVLELY